MLPASAIVRYFQKSERNSNGCWIWLGKIDRDGFPRFMVERKEWFVHRWAYQHFIGPLPIKCEIQQTCGNRTCVNPSHLRVTRLHQDEDRFNAKYSIQASGCWKWEDALNGAGYGSFSVNCRKELAHRWSYEKFIGPIPEGYVIDHLCRNKWCVNPHHLEPVTYSTNNLRGDPDHKKGAHLREKTHCPQGHPYAGDNVHVNTAGGRVCRTCCRERARTRRATNRATINA